MQERMKWGYEKWITVRQEQINERKKECKGTKVKIIRKYKQIAERWKRLTLTNKGKYTLIKEQEMLVREERRRKKMKYLNKKISHLCV